MIKYDNDIGVSYTNANSNIGEIEVNLFFIFRQRKQNKQKITKRIINKLPTIKGDSDVMTNSYVNSEMCSKFTLEDSILNVSHNVDKNSYINTNKHQNNKQRIILKFTYYYFKLIIK